MYSLYTVYTVHTSEPSASWGRFSSIFSKVFFLMQFRDDTDLPEVVVVVVDVVVVEDIVVDIEDVPIHKLK